MISRTVDAPVELQPVFAAAERVVSTLFHDKRELPNEGTIEIAGERYLLVRAASLSVRFFELVRQLYGEERADEADEFARNILFDIAHGIGKTDAECYAKRTGVEDPLARMAAGPVYFAHCGWARVRIDPRSVIGDANSYVLVYEHPYSFESDAWRSTGASADFPVCIMNAGYSSGWCEAAFGLPLVAAEVRCQARGDDACQFVMASPDRINAHIEALFARDEHCFAPSSVHVPDFMVRKRMEDELRDRQRKLEQKQSELSRSERFLHDIIESMPMTVFVKDAETLRFALINRAGEELAGVPRDALIGKTDFEVFPADQAERFVARDRAALASRTRVETEETIATAEGHRVLHAVTHPILDEQGRAAFLLGIAEDVTERKRQADELVAAGEALRQAKEEAEQANRAKSQFLANMSHEIRTPMNGILGMTELLSGMQLSGQQRDYVETIQQSAETLLHLLNGILDLSKVEAGHLQIETTGFSLREALGDALQTMATRAASKGLELIEHIAADVPDGLVGDPIRLRQVILNLVDNAVKFTAEGEIVVRIDRVEAEDEDDSVRLRFEVSDTGPGIAEADRKRIFKAFEQAGGGMTMGATGTGLGLAISTELVAMMGGKLQLDSELGRGSRFWFSIEFGIDEAAAAPEPRRGLMHGVPILVVDDNDTNRRVMVDLLASWHARPTAATNGPEAIERMHAAASVGDPFRVVLLDSMMPGMSGIEVARVVREDPSLHGTSLILLSSAGFGDEVSEAEELGVARFLTKPVKQSDLLGAIERELGGERARPAPELEPPTRPLRVLLAEDDPVNQKVASSLLALRGHRVTIVADGRAAVDRVIRDGASFDVVLMDVRMPEMDGLEATRAIRRWEREAGGHLPGHLPIVAMTAQAMAGDRERCLAAGMDAYVSKPVRGEALDEALRRVSEPWSRPAPSAPESGPLDKHMNEDMNEDEDTDGPVLDWDLASERLGGSEETMREVARVFRGQLDEMTKRVTDAVTNADADELRAVAHRLKGSAGALGADRVARLAHELELAGAWAQLEDAPAIWARLKGLLTKLEAELATRLSPSPSGEQPPG